jgi:polyisoprenoid-binding protein YceI
MAQIAAQDALATVGAGRWVLDGTASKVTVSHKTMWGLITVNGQFTQVTGEGEVDASGVVSGTLSIEAASIDTGNKKRDDHLRSADFFDVEHHPTITLTVSNVAAADQGLEAHGDLMVKQTHKTVPFTATITEASPDVVKATTEVTVDRNELGLTWNQMGMMKDITTVGVEAVFRRAT